MKSKFLPLALLSLICVSCGWTPVDDVYKLRNKTTYENFSALNDPAVMNFGITQKFISGGNTFTTEKSFGSLIFIYDWENNDIFDYVFSPESGFNSGVNQLFGLKKDSSNNAYYGFARWNERVTIMDPASTALKIENLKKNDMVDYAWADVKTLSSSKQLILYKKSYNGTDSKKSFYSIYDSESGEFNDKGSINCSFISDMSMARDEKNDTAWICYLTERESNHMSHNIICSIDLTTGVLTDNLYSFDSYAGEYDNYNGWNICFYYNILYADSDYIVVSKRKVEKPGSDEYYLEVINRSDDSISEIKLPDYNYSLCLEKLNGSYYLFTRDYGTRATAQKIDIANSSMTEVASTTEMRVFNSSFIRDNKLYFATSDYLSFKILGFDPSTESFDKLQELTIDSFDRK